MLCRADSKYLLSTVGCDIPNFRTSNSRDSSYCEIVTELHFFRSTQGVHAPLMKATIMHTSCNPVQSRDWLSSCQKLTSTVIFSESSVLLCVINIHVFGYLDYLLHSSMDNRGSAVPILAYQFLT